LCRGDIGFKGGGKGGLDRGDLVNLGENGQAREKRVDIKDYAFNTSRDRTFERAGGFR
jgi:hypothetical protein